MAEARRSTVRRNAGIDRGKGASPRVETKAGRRRITAPGRVDTAAMLIVSISAEKKVATWVGKRSNLSANSPVTVAGKSKTWWMPTRKLAALRPSATRKPETMSMTGPASSSPK